MHKYHVQIHLIFQTFKLDSDIFKYEDTAAEFLISLNI